MKRITSILLALVMILSLLTTGVVSTNAATTETFTDENGIQWQVTESYPGWSIRVVSGSVADNITTLVIPATYKNKAIVGLQGYAFEKCYNITDVIIPDSVIGFDYYCFSGHSGRYYGSSSTYDYTPKKLTNVHFSSIEHFNSLNARVFQRKFLYIGNNKVSDLVIPDSISELSGSFFGVHFDSIYVPKSLKTFNGSWFYDVLEKDNTKIIVEDIASWCSMEFKTYGTSMDMATQYSCNPLSARLNFYEGNTKIEDLVIPEGVTKINPKAFMRSGFKSVTLPSTCKEIGDSAFSRCNSLQSVDFGGVEKIGDNAFSVDGLGTDGRLHNISLPNNLKYIGSGAFSGQGFLTRTSISNWFTDGSRNHVTLIIPASIEYIGDSAFCWTTGTCEEKYYPEDYYDNYNRPTISLNGNPELGAHICQIYDINTNNFYWLGGDYSSESVLRYFTDDNGIAWEVAPYKNGWELRSNGNADYKGSITIPTEYDGKPIIKISSIPTYITGELYIPNGIKEIGDNAFYHGNGSGWDRNTISKIIISDSVESIGYNSFACNRYSGINLIAIELGNGVKTIGEGAFQGWSPSEQLQIPNSVTSVSRNAFANMGDIDLCVDTNTLSVFDGMAFYNTHVNDISIGSNLRVIDTPLLSGGQIDDELYLGEDVQIVNDYAFYGNDNMSIATPSTNNNVIKFAKSRNIPLRIVDAIMESGETANAIVTLDYDTANLRVTVPTVLPVSVDSDNNVTVATNAQIVNYSKGQVDVTNAVLSGSNSWTLAAFNTDFTKVPVDTKQYGFKLQGYSVPVSGNAYNNQFDTVDGNAALDLSYDANVAIQSEAVNAAEIGNIVFTVAWHK